MDPLSKATRWLTPMKAASVSSGSRAGMIPTRPSRRSWGCVRLFRLAGLQARQKDACYSNVHPAGMGARGVDPSGVPSLPVASCIATKT